ncbi:MAG: C/D box methylation guide ribonucleoprotein complex aNOP56 subunit [Candidatus Bathyarchaeota archaeon]|nr:C/D box methylation guide ribonucleoprotein complex aNOP56 subunit [Candidatus Bathyarchaeota archaeon]
MKTNIEETIIGIYASDEKGQIIGESLYPRNVNQIVVLIQQLRQGTITSHVASLMDQLLEKGVETVASTNQPLLTSIEEKYNVSIELTTDTNDVLRERIIEAAVEAGFISSADEYGEFSYNVSSLIARGDIHEALSERESLLIPTVQLLGDMDTILNSLSGRMREWYGVHFPEMGHRVKEHKDYARIVLKFGDKENITVKALQEMSFKKRDAERITEAAQSSMGAPMDPDDMEVVQGFTQRVMDFYNERERLVEYITGISEEMAPNIAHLAGPVLGAKLIEKAGGLNRISMMPASTIQVLGAEKAMFRALKTKARPPKHGLIFQHAYVHSAPRNKRGSRARSLAAKIAIAARADRFSGNFIADELLAQLQES